MVPAAACGPELLGGAQGEVRTVATSEEEGSSSTASIGERPVISATADDRALPPGSASLDESSSGQLEGDLEIDAAVWLVTEDGDLVPLTNGVVPGSFRIEGPADVLIGREDVEARTYSGVRIQFRRVTALVENGLIVNGTPVVGPVSVDLGATGSIMVERAVELTIERRATHTLVVDLDAHEWLPATVLPGRTVPGFIFSIAVDVSLR